MKIPWYLLTTPEINELEIIKPITQPTDISNLQMIERGCQCGCFRVFKCLEGSPQIYASQYCEPLNLKYLEDRKSKRKKLDSPSE